MGKNNVLLTIITFALGFFLSSLLNYRMYSECSKKASKADTVTIESVDTFTEVIHDTVVRFKPKFISERIIDSIEVKLDSLSTTKLPKTQRFYSDSTYNAWVSGYDPSLDSIRVFSKDVTRVISKDVVKYVFPKRTDFFIEAGSNFMKGGAAPFVGVSVKFKNDMFLGTDFGYFDKSAFVGVRFGIKLNK